MAGRGRGLRRLVVAAVVVPLAARALEQAARRRPPGDKWGDRLDKAGRTLRRFS